MRLFILITFCLTLFVTFSNAQEICNNNLDDDGDGLVDCRDGDCAAKACEICDNGFDDDGDGFIDCYDKECNLSASCGNFFLGQDASCEVRPDTIEPFQMKLKYLSAPNQTNHMNRLVAGDINNDGLPEIVTTYAAVTQTTPPTGPITGITASKINILSAPVASQTLTLEKSIDVTMGGLEGVAYEDIAMADINKDGCAEIFVITKNLSTSANYKIVAFDCNGNQVWTTPIAFAFDPGLIGLADFDHDGLVELYSRTQIFDAHTGALLGYNNIDDVSTGIHVGVNKGWGMNSNAPVAVDIVPATPGLELVAGCRIYGVNINRTAMTATVSLLKEYNNYATRTSRGQSNPTSVADFNQDGYLDVLAVGSDGAYDANTTIFFWDVQNNSVKKYKDVGTVDYATGWKNGAGRINIADIDGDTLMNAVYVSGRYLYALKEGATGLNLLWRENIVDETSGFTGCTTFDFNGDGKVEIVYRDEDYIYLLYTDSNGVVTRAAPIRCASRSHAEYPIVVDMDGDGSAEICVTCSTTNTTLGKNLAFFDQAEVRVYESANVPWVPARKVWNQHGYFVTNVNDDLSIPREQQLHHLIYAKNAPCRSQVMSRPLNSFMNQVAYLNSSGCLSYPAPDLSTVPNSEAQSIGYVPFTCLDDSIKVIFKYTNTGDVSVPGTTLQISFYVGDPQLSNPLATRLGTKSFLVSGINPGDIIADTVTIKNPGSAFDLFIVLNDNGSTIPLDLSSQADHIIECSGGNVITGYITPSSISLSTELMQDNLTCLTAPGVPGIANNGAVKANVLVGANVDFIFYWSNGVIAKPVDQVDYIGQIYTGLGSGAYTVYAVHKMVNCTSDPATLVVNDIVSSVDARIIQTKDFDDVDHPNGELIVIVNDTDNDGVGDPVGNFNYAWYSGPEILVDTVGTSHTLTGLGAGTFSVLVSDKSNGCYDSAYATIFRKETVLGAEDGGDLKGISMYPNPGTEGFTISIDNGYVGPVQLQLHSTMGNEGDKSIFSYKDTRTLQVPIDARKLKAGVYLIKISLGKETITKKWTKI